MIISLKVFFMVSHVDQIQSENKNKKGIPCGILCKVRNGIETKPHKQKINTKRNHTSKQNETKVDKNCP